MAKNIQGDMPHSLEAEQALLGCLLLDTKIQTEVASFVKEEDFYAESHKYIFSAMETIIKRNLPVDLVTLSDALEKNGTLEQAGGITYITELVNVMPSSANYQRYLDIVTRDSMLRRLIVGSAEIIDRSKKSTDGKETLAFAEKTVYDISNTADTSEMVKISSVIPQVITKIEELSSNKTKPKGAKTGFRVLDFILNGLHGSDLMILAARPAMGKTSLAMNIVENVAMQGFSCAVFSLEMGKEQLVNRMLSSVANVNMEDVAKGKLDRKDWLKLSKAREILNDKRIFINDSSMITPERALSMCRRLKRKSGLDFVMVDYIQLMSSQTRRNSDSRQNEISEISRNLKIMAKELDVPVLALSQLSRAVESEKRRPQLSDLRESGAIEQDADIVMFIHRPDLKGNEKEKEENKSQQNVAEIIIAKHRSGATGTVKLYFKQQCTKFVNLNEETGEPEEEGNKNTEVVERKTTVEPLPPEPENYQAEDFSPAFDESTEQKSNHNVDDEIF